MMSFQQGYEHISYAIDHDLPLSEIDEEALIAFNSGQRHVEANRKASSAYPERLAQAATRQIEIVPIVEA